MKKMIYVVDDENNKIVLGENYYIYYENDKKFGTLDASPDLRRELAKIQLIRANLNEMEEYVIKISQINKKFEEGN